MELRWETNGVTQREGLAKLSHTSVIELRGWQRAGEIVLVALNVLIFWLISTSVALWSGDKPRAGFLRKRGVHSHWDKNAVVVCGSGAVPILPFLMRYLM